jgi:hypothetical protein
MAPEWELKIPGQVIEIAFGAGEALRLEIFNRFFVFVSKAYRNDQFLGWTFCWTFYWTRFIGADEGFKRFTAADETAAFVLFRYC